MWDMMVHRGPRGNVTVWKTARRHGIHMNEWCKIYQLAVSLLRMSHVSQGAQEKCHRSKKLRDGRIQIVCNCCCNVVQRLLSGWFRALRLLGSVAAALQQTAMHCNALQCTATHCHTLPHTATHRNTLQHTATHCNTLQHTAAHCNTLQHTATHCNTTYRAIEPWTNLTKCSTQWPIELKKIMSGMLVLREPLTEPWKTWDIGLGRQTHLRAGWSALQQNWLLCHECPTTWYVGSRSLSHMHAHTYTYTHTHIHIHAHTHTHTRTHTHTYTRALCHTRVLARVDTRTHVWMWHVKYTCMRWKCKYTNTKEYTYRHTSQ